MPKNLEQTIKQGATQWAKRFTILAKANAPKHIAPYISTKSTVVGDKVVLVSGVKVVNKPNYGTMDAVAQEYGYPGAIITPKKGAFLAFPWDVNLVGAPRLPDGRILIRKVERKPMPAYNSGKGYMRVAAEEWKMELKGSSSAFKKAIKLDVMDAFNRITKASMKK